MRNQAEVKTEGEKVTTLSLRRLAQDKIVVKYDVPHTDDSEGAGNP